MIKNPIAVFVATLVMASSCASAGEGAYNGAAFGSILGSAIGGISDGPRGHDLGTIVGMAGGAIIGAAIGNAVEQRQQAAQQEGYPQSKPKGNASSREESGYDPQHGGDDRLYDFHPENSASSDVSPSAVPVIEMRNVRFVDNDGDGAISRGEVCKVVFEVFNRGKAPLQDLLLLVEDIPDNRHVYISPSLRVERVNAGKGIRYTATVVADKGLREGMLDLRLSVMQGAPPHPLQTQVLQVPARR